MRRVPRVLKSQFGVTLWTFDNDIRCNAPKKSIKLWKKFNISLWVFYGPLTTKVVGMMIRAYIEAWDDHDRKKIIKINNRNEESTFSSSSLFSTFLSSINPSSSSSSLSGQTFMIISLLLLLLLLCCKSDRERWSNSRHSLWKWFLFCFQCDLILSLHFQNCNSTSYAANRRLQSTSIRNPQFAYLAYIPCCMYKCTCIHIIENMFCA